MHRFDQLEILRTRARAIRPVMFPALNNAVLEEVTNHRELILSCSDQEKLLDYIHRATDAECLCALSEMYLSAPLNDAYYHLFAYLVVTVFTALGLEVPEDILDADGRELTASEVSELESLRRGIRLTQKRTMPRGGH